MTSIEEFFQRRKLGRFDTGSKDLEAITRLILKTLIAENKKSPALYRHGNVPVWVLRDDAGALRFQVLGLDQTRAVLARRFDWYRMNKKHKEVAAAPPMEVVRDFLAYPNLDLPQVDRIVRVPVLGFDGKIVMQRGYNPGSRIIFNPDGWFDKMPRVSLRPCRKEIEHALSLFDELVCNFPFVGSGKTHTLAATLVPFVRALIQGPVPLHLFEKPEPGTGATLLAQVIGDICVGYSISSITESRNADEFMRKIHSILRSGPSVVFLDNLTGRLDSAALAVALTNDLLEDRIVQRSQTIAVPVRCLWLAAANNPSLSAEIARRTIPIRLDARMRRPHERVGFKYPNLRQQVADHRGSYIWAMLNLAQAWIAAGRPKGKERMGMFESYCEIIGGILEVAGVRGFLDIPAERNEITDEGSLTIAPLISGWFKAYSSRPVGASDLLYLCSEIDLPGTSDGSKKIQLGKLLRANRGRRFGDLVIVPAGHRENSNLWSLAPANEDELPTGKGGVGE